MLNSTFIRQQAELMAERVERDAGADREQQIRRAFAITFGRAPDDDETSSAIAHVSEHGLPSLCRVLTNANEFLFLP
jgi:hypothetical protein